MFLPEPLEMFFSGAFPQGTYPPYCHKLIPHGEALHRLSGQQPPAELPEVNQHKIPNI